MTHCKDFTPPGFEIANTRSDGLKNSVCRWIRVRGIPLVVSPREFWFCIFTRRVNETTVDTYMSTCDEFEEQASSRSSTRGDLFAGGRGRADAAEGVRRRRGGRRVDAAARVDAAE